MGKIDQPVVRFHPLKAGRRLSSELRLVAVSPAFPSPQGGSETLAQRIAQIACESFHPLKAGRRPECFAPDGKGVEWFPSPQGGSETGQT